MLERDDEEGARDPYYIRASPTGADLKRLVEDGKALFAYDKAKGFPLKPPTDYFLEAAEFVRSNNQRLAAASAKAALRPQSDMAGFASMMMRSFATDDDESR